MFLDKLSKKEKIGLGVACAFLFLAFLDRLIVDPISMKIQRINRQIKISEKQFGHDLRNLNQKEYISREYQKYVKYLTKSGSDEEEVASILGEIESLSRQSSVRLVDMKPQDPHQKDFYKQYRIEVEAEGHAEALLKFLHHLNSSSQLLRVEKLRLKRKGKDPSTIKASLRITKVIVSELLNVEELDDTKSSK